jgi:hypothetical protein
LNDGVIGHEQEFIFLWSDLDLRGVGVSEEGLDGCVGGGVDDGDIRTGLSDQQLLRKVVDGVGHLG